MQGKEVAMNIYIGNLDRTIRAEDLRKFFNGYGSILDAKVTVSSDKPLGYANVYLVPDEAAREAIEELNFAPLKGRPIRLRECVFRAAGERRINKAVWGKADRRRYSDRRHESEAQQSSFS